MYRALQPNQWGHGSALAPAEQTCHRVLQNAVDNFWASSAEFMSCKMSKPAQRAAARQHSAQLQQCWPLTMPA